MNVTKEQAEAKLCEVLSVYPYPKAYVRCWHLGERGWFVVDTESYARIWPPQKVDSTSVQA